MSTEGFKVSQEILNELPNELDALRSRVAVLEQQFSAVCSKLSMKVARVRYRTGMANDPYYEVWEAFSYSD